MKIPTIAYRPGQQTRLKFAIWTCICGAEGRPQPDKGAALIDWWQLHSGECPVLSGLEPTT